MDVRGAIKGEQRTYEMREMDDCRFIISSESSGYALLLPLYDSLLWLFVSWLSRVVERRGEFDVVVHVQLTPAYLGRLECITALAPVSYKILYFVIFSPWLSPLWIPPLPSTTNAPLLSPQIMLSSPAMQITTISLFLMPKIPL